MYEIKPLEQTKQHLEVWWDIHVSGPLFDMAFFDCFDRLYLQRLKAYICLLLKTFYRREGQLQSSSKPKKNRPKADIIIQEVINKASYKLGLEIGAAESELPDDKEHQEGDKKKLEKIGKEILDKILVTVPSEMILQTMVPLLLHHGTEFQLYGIRRLFDNMYVLFPYADFAAPVQLRQR